MDSAASAPLQFFRSNVLLMHGHNSVMKMVPTIMDVFKSMDRFRIMLNSLI